MSRTGNCWDNAAMESFFSSPKTERTRRQHYRTRDEVDRFAKFKLTAWPSEEVRAPLIKECYANFKCRFVDSSLINKYSLVVIEIVKAHAPKVPKFPQALHYRSVGLFMMSGPAVSKDRRGFKLENL